MRLIDGLEGVVYLLDRHYRIVDFGRRHWRDFARAGGAEALLDDANVQGRCLFDFIASPEVRDAQRSYIDYVFKGVSPEVVLPYRCDAPELERLCRLSIQPLDHDGPPVLLVVQSITLAERSRPRIELFRFLHPPPDDDWPLLSMCSYCQQVRLSEERGGKWVPPERYYRSGGTSRVAVTHTICPDCFDAFVAPYAGR